LKNVAKVLERFKGVKGLTRVLTRSLTKVWPLVLNNLIKIMISIH
jgi:hypothetical protein